MGPRVGRYHSKEISKVRSELTLGKVAQRLAIAGIGGEKGLALLGELCLLYTSPSPRD